METTHTDKQGTHKWKAHVRGVWRHGVKTVWLLELADTHDLVDVTLGGQSKISLRFDDAGDLETLGRVAKETPDG